MARAKRKRIKELKGDIMIDSGDIENTTISQHREVISSVRKIESMKEWICTDGLKLASMCTRR